MRMESDNRLKTMSQHLMKGFNRNNAYISDQQCNNTIESLHKKALQTFMDIQNDTNRELFDINKKIDKLTLAVGRLTDLLY